MNSIDFFIDDLVRVLTKYDSFSKNRNVRFLLRELFRLMDDENCVTLNSKLKQQICSKLKITGHTLTRNIAILKKNEYITSMNFNYFKMKAPKPFNKGNLQKIIDNLTKSSTLELIFTYDINGIRDISIHVKDHNEVLNHPAGDSGV